MDTTNEALAEATKEALANGAPADRQEQSAEEQMARVREILSTPISEEDAARQLADLDMREAWCNMVRERAAAELAGIDQQIASIRCARAEIKVRQLVPAKAEGQEA